MPGLKRKASQPVANESPPKLKKQSTSTTIVTGHPTIQRKKEIPQSPPRLKKADSEKQGKKLMPKKSPVKPHKMPRFPTLKPTAPLNDGPDFTFSAPNFYKKASMKKAPTLLIKEESVKEKVMKKAASKGPTVELTSQPTEILQPVIEVDPGATRATDIEKKIQMLPSGSVLGKITNLEFDEDMSLPSNASLVIYEFSEESSSTSFGATPGKPCPPQSRPSAIAVADYFTATDGSKDFGFSDEEFISGVEDSDSTAKSGATNGTPSKSPKKVPGGVREIVFSFDTTGSMYNYMEEAGEKIKDLVSKLQVDIPGIRLAFIAHGDYYDLKQDRYLIKWLDFGASIEETAKFFENLNITHGGDADECYELALRKVREALSWTPGSQRCLVMIGDSDPHEPGYKFDEFVNDIDWRVEASLLRDMGVRIYGMQVGYRSDFYRQISQITGGAHLRIDNASFTYDMLMSICLREGSLKLLKSYENEVRKSKKEAGEVGLLDLELERLFSSLKSVEDNKSSKVKMKLKLQAEKEEEEKSETPTKRPLDTSNSKPSQEPSPKKSKINKFELLTPKLIKERKKAEKAAKKAEKLSKKDTFTKLKTVSEKKIMPSKKEITVKKSVGRPKKNLSVKQNKAKEILKKTVSKKPKQSVKKVIKETKVIVKKALSEKKVNLKNDLKSPGKRPVGRPPGKGKNQSVEKKSDAKPQMKKPINQSVTKKSVGRPPVKNSVKKPVKKTGGKPLVNKSTGKPAVKKPVEKPTAKKPVEKKLGPVKKRGRPPGSAKKTTKEMNKSNLGKKPPGRPAGKIVKNTKITKELKISNKKAEAIRKVFISKTSEKVSVKAQKNEKVSVKAQKNEKVSVKAQKKETKGSPVVKSSKTQSPSKPLSKKPREAATLIKFTMAPLNTMFWDDWNTFLVAEKPGIKSSEWKKSPSWCPGFYNTSLYTDSKQVTGVYEIAVSPPNSNKRYPVYFNIKSLWENFDTPSVKNEIERILKKKGCISVRRGVLKKPSETGFQKVVEFIAGSFDYAWQGRSEKVVKDGFCISTL